ncbi:MAG TPA: hypothetical protein VLB69_05655 [Rudaea sp.]|nr:hypothetical protein [Rudaea sp.]
MIADRPDVALSQHPPAFAGAALHKLSAEERAARKSGNGNHFEKQVFNCRIRAKKTLSRDY